MQALATPIYWEQPCVREQHEPLLQNLLQFLNLGTIYILGQIILHFSIYLRIFRNILGLRLLDAIVTPKLSQPKVPGRGQNPHQTCMTSYKAVVIIWYLGTGQLRPMKARDVLEEEFRVGFLDQERPSPLGKGSFWLTLGGQRAGQGSVARNKRLER